jgi:DNA-binding LacI/PurR family transcriptional regulator
MRRIQGVTKEVSSELRGAHENMEFNGLANWTSNELAALARRLRVAVMVAGGPEQLLWNELLRRLGKSLGPLAPEDAVRVMHLESHPNHDKAVNEIAHKLRERIKIASEGLNPSPHVRLAQRTYAIVADDNEPPQGWKQDIGPSIGLLLADATDEFVGRLILGITEVCNAHNYDLVVDVCADDPIAEVKKVKRLVNRTDGLLIVPASSDNSLLPSVEQILRDGDCVLIDRYLRELPDVACVHCDDISAGRQAGRFLEKCGCSRVLIVDQGSRSDNNFTITPLEDRAKGCKIQLGDRIPIRHLPAAGSDEEGGFLALQDFDQKYRLAASDGIFALTDRLALGCKHYLATMTSPLNLPLIGIEGRSFGDYMKPQLASIQFDDVEMGRLAAKVLFAKLQIEKVPPTTECAPHYLIPPILLEPSTPPTKRKSSPVLFPDAATHYPPGKNRAQ